MAGKSGLRFDRVALHFVDRLRRALRDDVPTGATLLLTCTAPIRQSSKTAAALEATVRRALSGKRPAAELRASVEGNDVRARLVSTAVRGSPNVLGFVHNPDVDAAGILAVAEAVLEALAAKSSK
ncbi:MAG: hypothetical protein JO241_07615 [Candidatus Eremiobacteraeota bacterium]|nr:hypothetical protein [Candidatus Eremiobacteraeota bacterium]